MNTKTLLRAALSATSILAVAGCALDLDASSDTAEPVARTSQTFEEFEASVPRDPTDGAYLVEGDIGIPDEASLRRYHEKLRQSGGLIVNERDDGGDDRWSNTEKGNLTYCISGRFEGLYADVVAAMKSATSSWEEAAAVRFIHRDAADTSCRADQGDVVFAVLPTRNTTYNARAFFPGLAGEGERRLFVDVENATRAAPKTLTGILRHELGHALGFRHEHTRPEGNGMCTEAPNWRPLTPYDPGSVMHYNAQSPCEGSNGGDYVLSPLDKAGAEALYGRP